MKAFGFQAKAANGQSAIAAKRLTGKKSVRDTRQYQKATAISPTSIRDAGIESISSAENSNGKLEGGARSVQEYVSPLGAEYWPNIVQEELSLCHRRKPVLLLFQVPITSMCNAILPWN